MREITGKAFLQNVFPRVSEGGVSEIVSESRRFREILVEREPAGDGPCDLRDLKRVGKPRAVVVILGREKDLRLVHQAAKRLAMQNAVAVSLKLRAVGAGRGELFPASRIFAEKRKFRKEVAFPFTDHLRNSHKGLHSAAMRQTEIGKWA